MAGRNQKEVPFSNTATKVGMGLWQWDVGGVKWQFDDGKVGLNMGPVRPDGSCRYELFFKNIREAACFSEGFHAGARTDTKSAELLEMQADATRAEAAEAAERADARAEAPRDA